MICLEEITITDKTLFRKWVKHIKRIQCETVYDLKTLQAASYYNQLPVHQDAPRVEYNPSWRQQFIAAISPAARRKRLIE